MGPVTRQALGGVMLVLNARSCGFLVAVIASLIAATTESFARPLGATGALPPLVQTAVGDAYEIAYDIDDIPCGALGRSELLRKAERTLARLTSDREQTARNISDPGQRTEILNAIDRARNELDGALEDYDEDCSRSRLFVIPGTDIAMRLDGYVKAGSDFTGSKLGVGVVVTPGDPFFAKQKDSIDAFSLGGSLNFRSGQLQHSLGVGFLWGEQKVSAQKAAGGDSVGYVPGDVAFGNGISSGAAFTGISKVSVREIELNYSAMREFNIDNGFGWGWGTPTEEQERESRKRLGLAATLDVRLNKHSGQLFWTDTPADLDIKINQQLTTTRFTLGPAIGGRRKLGSGFYIFGYADAQAGLMYSSLDSREDILCPACGGALPQMVDINDSKLDFAWRGSLQAGAGYMIRRNLDVKLTGGLQFGNQHIIDVRRNPTDASTGIGTQTGINWNLGFKIHSQF
jgi:hypothetical protein